MAQTGTLIDDSDSFELRAHNATDTGAQLAEQRKSGQIARVVQFLAATYNGRAFTFDLFERWALDVDISDDMLRCLDALRWGCADLCSLVADGDARVRAVIAQWGLRWPQDS